MNPQDQPNTSPTQSPAPALPPERMVDETELPQVNNQPPAPQPKKSKKKLWIGLSALIVALLVGGVAGAMWWTSPEKAFNDATSMTVFPKGGQVKGAMEIESESSPAVTLDYNVKYQGMRMVTDLGIKADSGMVNFNMTGGLATDTDKSMYFKVNNVKKTISSFAGEDNTMVQDIYGGLIDKIDGKWVQMTEADMKELTKDSGVNMSCAIDIAGKVGQNKAYTDEIQKIYSQNKYIVLKKTVGSESVEGVDSHRYEVDMDQSKMDGFGKALKTTTFYKDLSKCFSEEQRAELDQNTESTNTSQNPMKFEVWVDKWSHKPNKFMLSTSENGTKVKFSGLMTYNDTQKVDIPKADTQFKELRTEVEKLQTEMEGFSTDIQ